MKPHKDDLDYIYFLKQLVEGKKFEGIELGISKLAIDKGMENLSEKQKSVLDIAIKNLVAQKCQSCQCKIPWSEMYQAIDSGRCLGCIPN